MNWFVSFILTFTLPAALFATDLVHTTDTLSQGRVHLAATTIGNKAIFAGGCNSIYAWSGTVYEVVGIYDATTGFWSTATLSQARGCLAAAAVGSKDLFAGGLAGDNY
ncbi:MAG: hypothetical protein ACYTEL_25565 [Planctomycetota bacterium]|jgi:hypothetical protein